MVSFSAENDKDINLLYIPEEDLPICRIIYIYQLTKTPAAYTNRQPNQSLSLLYSKLSEFDRS